MGTFRSGELVLLSFPYSDVQGVRRRPALVLLDTGDEDIIVAKVTSQMARSPFDVELAGWQQAGLLLPSAVRLDKLATLAKRLVERSLGNLNHSDWESVRSAVQRLWSDFSISQN